MPKKKIYAVRNGRQTGLFATWDECKRLVHGYPGAVYKSFETEQEALAYLAVAEQQNMPPQMSEAKQQDRQQIQEPEAQASAEDLLIAYVDGSYEHKKKRYSFGCVLLTPQGEIIRESGSGNDPKSLALRNVSGEMQGAMFAVKWAISHGYEAVDIRYDYAGIEQWATHGWQAKNELTKQYAEYMERCGSRIRMTFTKIAAHTGDRYNEEADQLAKKALEVGHSDAEYELLL
ncbi:MAG: ribonuclease H family protein [Eubacterium sp.]|nr:ribonuclease H family protein [Eubacterium sp.]